MKWSPILHYITWISAVLGVLALVAAWIAGGGNFLGFTQAHLFEDTKALLLASVAFGIGTLIHQNQERRK